MTATLPLVVVCAWCGVLLRDERASLLEDAESSHGICSPCSARVAAEFLPPVIADAPEVPAVVAPDQRVIELTGSSRAHPPCPPEARSTARDLGFVISRSSS